MAKKLWNVSLTIETLIAADDENSAREILVDQATEILDSVDLERDALVREYRYRPAGWDNGDIPWSSYDTDKTFGEYLAERYAPEPRS